jgi:cell division septum initiation protein DivIVA
LSTFVDQEVGPRSHVCEENTCCLIVTGQLQSVLVRGPRDNDDLVPLHEPFETALRGFNRRQVLEHLESLDGRVAIIAADRDAALAQVAELTKALNHLRSESELLVYLRREAEKAAAQVERILSAPMAQAGARIQRILELAEEEAAELKIRAQSQIAAEKTRADQDIAEFRAAANQDIAELRARAEEQIAALRASASREAKSLLEHVKRQCDQLESESAARRQAAEQDSAQAIAQRESEANDRIRAEELGSLASLHIMARMMGDDLTDRSRAVERDEAALRELRAQVSSEVGGLDAVRAEVTAAVVATHQLLGEALGQVRKLAAQSPATDLIEQPDVPTQRGSQAGPVYLLNAGADERRSPRTHR